ncbi:helix-turn-helix domain-containing protein [Halomonas ventosae]|uniref:Helix-turn-helix protein n=1 Tax=Halomonas ventosae TaxID=229007 RepID=A0A2T0VL68_9GAMM|nr:helix-turn-helix domain-containing protein [Halomonas ventosae]PRY70991.1 helix-turn-helix protein [Halomonas ventosae]
MTTDMKRPDLEGGRAESNADSTSCKVNPSTHQARVLQALQARPMSAAELQWELRIAHAPSVVRELVAKGYRIGKDDFPNPNPDSRCRTIQRYCLAEFE